MTLASLTVLGAIAASAPEAIGIGTSVGSFRVAGAAVVATGSIPEGATVETELASSRVMLRSGAAVELGRNSRARVFSDRIVLESGRSRVAGPARVTNSQGILLAKLNSGHSLDFLMPEASSTVVRISGTVEIRDEAIWMTDELTKVQFRLSGQEDVVKTLQATVGKKAAIEGTISNDVIEAAKVTAVELPPAVPATSAAKTAPMASSTSKAASVTAAASKTAAAAAGISSKAIIAGVVIAGAAGGTAVGFAQASGSSTQTISQ